VENGSIATVGAAKLARDVRARDREVDESRLVERRPGRLNLPVCGLADLDPEPLHRLFVL
jgi:hypothetical protein